MSAARSPAEGAAEPFVLEVSAPGETAGAHFSNVAMAGVLSDARVRHLLALGLPREEVLHPAALPYVVEVLIRYRAAVVVGEALRCTVRAVSRGRSSFVVEQVVTSAGSGRIAATCRCVQVFVDSSTGRTAPFPPRLLAAMEGREGALAWEPTR